MAQAQGPYCTVLADVLARYSFCRVFCKQDDKERELFAQIRKREDAEREAGATGVTERFLKS